MELARRGVISEEMRYIAEREDVSAESIRRKVAEGRIVIPKNVNREFPPIGIGEGLRVKVNANIGTSRDLCDVNLELRKAEAAIEAGADTIMDLSTGGDLDEIRRRILREVKVPLGTVPIYQAAIEAQSRHGAIVEMTEDDIFNVIERHAKDGVDFMTVHCGVTRESVERIIRQRRLLGIVSRGGTFLTAWIIHNQEENPLYANYDYLLEIAREYDVTLSLGDGLRPGCIHDATDKPQIQELLIIGELVKRAREAGVQAMVEGPGHIPLDQIEMNVKLEKSICDGAPFYVLGPLVTDVAPGYDHIVGAIGGALAAMAGADFLCYVTPSEHLALPSVEDVREGVIAARIAAHAADLVRRREIEAQWDYEISKARADLDWERQFKYAIDPLKARMIRESRSPRQQEVCTMCGEFCAIKLLKRYLIHAEH
ncbi:phosphomethylpyrimidine synthase ThiC [Candidatus Bathyarchaeota archaeon]|nr:phosphomethylpyrimidine synthase ThiC [Candidatus Bathyarchaeota archaeon]